MQIDLFGANQIFAIERNALEVQMLRINVLENGLGDSVEILDKDFLELEHKNESQIIVANVGPHATYRRGEFEETVDLRILKKIFESDNGLLKTIVLGGNLHYVENFPSRRELAADKAIEICRKYGFTPKTMIRSPLLAHGGVLECVAFAAYVLERE